MESLQSSYYMTAVRPRLRNNTILVLTSLGTETFQLSSPVNAWIYIEPPGNDVITPEGLRKQCSLTQTTHHPIQRLRIYFLLYQ